MLHMHQMLYINAVINGYTSMLHTKKLLISISSIMIFLLVSSFHVGEGGGNSLNITRKGIEIDNLTLINSVAPFPSQWFSSDPENERAQRLMDKYLLSILDWDDILLKEFKTVPGFSDMGYYGDGRNVENAIRPICYAAFTNAFLSKINKPPAGTKISEDRRIQMKDCAIKAIRYLTHSHVTGEGECAGGGKWGNQWQSSLWTRAAAMAGWILWKDLDQTLKIDVARMLEYEANRFIDAEPRNQEYDNTGAEENAWNSHCTSLAFNMIPTHPNRDKWDKAAKKFMYNSYSVAADLKDTTIGDNDKMIKEWVSTINAHPDYTLENHSRIHIGYLKTTLTMLLENALNYELMGNQVPAAMFHNVPEAFEIMKKSMMKDGAAVFWGSNDWRVIHTQATDIISYAVISLLNADRAAAYLEDVAIDYMRSLQQHNNGYYNFRRDLEWSGFAATRMINAYLLHAILGEGSPPLSEEEYDSLYNNVSYFPYGKTVIHRTSTKFASFSWNAYLLALSLNKNGNWQNWPRESSYLGLINGSEAGRKEVSIESIHPELNENGFTITGRLKRNANELSLIQNVSFTSLPGDITVYIERLTKVSGSITSRETGLVGHEFELYEPERILYIEDGTAIVSINGNESIKMYTNWLNIGGKIGYVVCRNGVDNMMTYHYSTERNRNCDYINLIGETGSEWTGDWACVVTFLNQDEVETATWAEKVVFNVDGNSATCKIGDQTVSVDFKDGKDSP